MSLSPSDLNMGVPWDSISQPAGGEQIPEIENLRTGLARALAPAGQLAGQEETQRAMENLRQMQATMKAHNDASQRPPQATKTTTKVDPNGNRTVSIEGPAELAEYYGKAGQFYQQALGGYAKQMDEIQQQLKAQEQNIRNQPPWVQLATALSANLASQKDMPGWVRGLGQTAAQLNPQADQIRNQRLAVLGQEAEIAQRGAALNESALRTGIERERLGVEQTREARLAEDQIRKATEDATRDIRDTRDKLLAAAGEGKAPPAAVVSQLLAEKKLNPTEVSALTNAITKTNEAALARIEADRKIAERRVAALEKGVTSKTSDKEDAKKALEATAQSLASGDLTAIRQISSLRTGERTKLYARIKELNPNFNAAEVDRKIKTLDSFTVGKDGQSLQSFDTFLQHAGELEDTLGILYQSQSPALNKPINWIRKNAEGNPEYQRLLVALEPVGKEFESFLLNQRALYVDDRKRIEVLMNGNSSPAQIKSALEQMGKTAKDRFAAMNQRYRRVMGQDIENPFSPEAEAAAKKIGLTLPEGSTGKSKYPWEK